MKDIKEIFSDTNAQPFHINNDKLNLIYADKGSVCNHVFSLSEVFTEWYLFDSSYQKNIQIFLASENLMDVFTESEFMDLMCGGAYLDDDLIQFIAMKLPFRITSERLHTLNQSVHATNSAYIIKSKPSLADKISTIFQLKQQIKQEKKQERRKKIKEAKQKIKHENRLKRQEHKRRVKHEYYVQNKEYIQKIKREYYLKTQEHAKERSKKYYATHKESIKQYYENHKEQRQKWHREYYIAHKETVQKRNKEYYAANKEKQGQYLKEYYISHQEEQKQYARKYYATAQENKAKAKTMCAAYIFFLKFKKENRDKYLEFYTKYHDPLHGMFKTCIALQNMDINMCPFYNAETDQSIDQCCNQKLLSVPNAINEIHTIANKLKQR